MNAHAGADGPDPHLVVVFDAQHRLRTACADIVGRTGLAASNFAVGQSLDAVQSALVAALPHLRVSRISLADGGVVLSLRAGRSALGTKSRFLSTMTHELRTPLNVVIGFADQLSREAGQGGRLAAGQVAEFAAAILDAGHTLLGLVNTILDVARIEQGRIDLQNDTIDIAHLVNSCVAGGQEQARKAGVSLAGTCESGTVRMRGDERRLRQMLAALLENAVASCRAGGRVTVSAQIAGGALSFAVADTGVGIAPDRLGRVFDPFSHADDGLAARTHGVGLGLYICRALVEAHGGTITLTSAPGAGTTAIVNLPPSRLVEPSASFALSQEPS